MPHHHPRPLLLPPPPLHPQQQQRVRFECHSPDLALSLVLCHLRRHRYYQCHPRCLLLSACISVEASIVVQKVLEGKNDFGYDAREDKYVNMFKAGIIDPAKVSRVAVENAASISGLLLTTEAAITEQPEEHDHSPMPGGAPDMGMGGMGGMM